MAAGGLQRAADEGGGGQAVGRRELADRVEQEDRRPRTVGAAAADETGGCGGEALGDRGEALRMARGDDQHRSLAGRSAVDGEPAPRRENLLLLALHGRSGDDDRAPRREPFETRGELRVAGGRRGIELEVSGDGDPLAGHAERHQAIAIDGGLHAEAVDRSEEERQRQPPKTPQAGEAAVAHPAVDDRDGDPARAGGAQQEGPEVALHQHQGGGSEATEEALDRAGELEREIGHGTPVSEAGGGGPGLVLPGRRDGGHQDGQIARQARRERAREGGLADRNGVNPESSRAARGGLRVAGDGRKTAESSPQRRQVVAAPQDEQPGTGDKEGQGGQGLIDPPHRDRGSIIKRFSVLPGVDRVRSAAPVRWPRFLAETWTARAGRP